jgi:hypothetical protein
MSYSSLACLGGLALLLPAQSAEPGASPGVDIIDISNNSQQFASAFPFVEVSPKDDNLVAVAWRLYSLPIDTNAPKGSRTADCHIAISRDGGRTFHDSNLMSVLRTERSGTMPELWYCNAPWASFGPDGTVYAGGALFTASGVIGPEPKQGRQMVTVSRDGGATWSKGVPGLTVDKFAPGVTGIEGGKEPQDTPWDGAKRGCRRGNRNFLFQRSRLYRGIHGLGPHLRHCL